MNFNRFCDICGLYKAVKKMTKLKQVIQRAVLKHDSSSWIPASLQVYDTRVPEVIMCASTSYACQSIWVSHQAANIRGLHWFLQQMRSLTRFCSKEVVSKSQC